MEREVGAAGRGWGDRGPALLLLDPGLGVPRTPRLQLGPCAQPASEPQASSLRGVRPYVEGLGMTRSGGWAQGQSGSPCPGPTAGEPPGSCGDWGDRVSQDVPRDPGPDWTAGLGEGGTGLGPAHRAQQGQEAAAALGPGLPVTARSPLLCPGLLCPPQGSGSVERWPWADLSTWGRELTWNCGGRTLAHDALVLGICRSTWFPWSPWEGRTNGT